MNRETGGGGKHNGSGRIGRILGNGQTGPVIHKKGRAWFDMAGGWAFIRCCNGYLLTCDTAIWLDCCLSVCMSFMMDIITFEGQIACEI